MDRSAEFAIKYERLRALLRTHGVAGLVLRSRANVSWLGCGPADDAPLSAVQGSRSEVWHQSDGGVAWFVVTDATVTLVTENIELPRLARDEFGGLPIDILAQPWHESDPSRAIAELVRGPVGTDSPGLPVGAGDSEARLMTGEIAACRAELTERERDRYRWLGRRSAEIMSEVCRAIRPGMPEAEVVALAHERLHRLGIAQEVDIVCSDDRLAEDRHGLYTDRRINELAMVVFCAHKWGLVANLTRMVALAVPSAETLRRHEAISRMDHALMLATRPGTALRDVFRDAVAGGYAALGEPDAWRDHHQGGSTGYTGRDTRVTPTSAGTVGTYQAFAWNPSLVGVKSEDTFITTPAGPETLTVDPFWPTYAATGKAAILDLTGSYE